MSILCGVLAGSATMFFLSTLELVTKIRFQFPHLILGLPIAGLLTGWIYQKYGSSINRGHNLILDEIHEPKSILPLRMAPLLWLTTIISHLFGASVGREGTAVQMSASLSDQLSHFFKLGNAERKILLVAGMGAGFGTAIGAPWAGVFFGMEVLHVGRLKPFAWFECFVATFTAFYFSKLIGVQHSHYNFIEVDFFDFKNLFFITLSGVLFGLTANLFVQVTHWVENYFFKYIRNHLLMPTLGGIFLISFYFIFDSGRYAGLGLHIIQENFETPSSFLDPILKMTATVLSVASGFKGGEFVPLVFIGTSLGSALSFVFPISFKLLAAVGFVSVFAGTANTPIACSIMAIELFGFSIAPYAIIGCFVSYYCSGNKGIYKSQIVSSDKSIFKWIGNYFCKK